MAVERHQGVRPTSHLQGTFGPRGRRVRPARGVANSHSPGYSQRGRVILRSSPKRRSEKFFVANLATAAATHSTRQDGGNTSAEESPTRSVLDPLIGRTRG